MGQVRWEDGRWQEEEGGWKADCCRQGIAHFLEHVLFLGTEKYPKSGDFKKVLSSSLLPDTP
eukprot:750295-Hanusia_phi.AAC.2